MSFFLFVFFVFLLEYEMYAPRSLMKKGAVRPRYYCCYYCYGICLSVCLSLNADLVVPAFVCGE